MAYRSRKEQRRVDAAEGGLVVDMVQQFADRYAFVRELVQNGIDAGATRLTMRAQYLGADAVFSLLDDGAGMSQQIIEGPLLTLFNSAKDEDDTKIGKYGVGFVSVFALEPDAVVVETWRQGEAFELVVLPDHSYELCAADPPAVGPKHGTRVSLRKRMNRAQFVEHADEVASALVRWCQHARLPIEWVMDAEGGEPRRERIDRPLSVASPVVVDVHVDGMRIAVGAGLGAEVATEEPNRPHGFAGFYNHGLTLFETVEPFTGLDGVRFKVDCPGLSYTLSRDNVRHDDVYDNVLRRVRQLAGGALRERVIEELAEAAREADLERHGELLYAAAGTLSVPARLVEVPLCEPIDGEEVVDARALERDGVVLYRAESNRMTRALALEGIPVMRGQPAMAALVALARQTRATLHPPETVFTLLLPMTARSRSDAALEEMLQKMLAAAGWVCDDVALVEVDGVSTKRACFGVDHARGRQLLHEGGASHRSRWRRHKELMVPVADAMVAAARKLARSDVTSAAHLLARYLFVAEHGELTKRQSDALLSCAAGRLGPGERSEGAG